MAWRNFWTSLISTIGAILIQLINSGFATVLSPDSNFAHVILELLDEHWIVKSEADRSLADYSPAMF